VRVEVLYVAECPWHPAAVKLVKDVLAAEGVAAEIQEVLARDEGMAEDLDSLVRRRSESMGEMSPESRRMRRALR
jgi:hypothetical protein